LHFPVVFSIGSVKIPAHTVFEICAYSVAYAVYRNEKLSGKDYYAGEMRLKLTLWTIFGAFLGSRILALFEDPSAFPGQAAGILFAFFASKTILGAFAGGLLTTEVAKYFLRQKRSTGDKLVIPIIVGIIVGRVGCFLGGLEDRTQGAQTLLPWGVDYGDGLRRHPLPLYEIIYCFCVWILMQQNGILWRHGGKFQFLLATYFTYRFFMEFLKDRFFLYGSLSAIQCVSLAGILYYTILWLKRLPVRMR
jgi:phosphatidylglycerol---prolipoprotein diacylglyceryl transferase